MINVRHFCFNRFCECCHIAWKDAGRAVIVDPGAVSEEEMAELRKCMADAGISPAAILLTHAHFDHIYGTKRLQDEFGIPVYMNRLDEITIERTSAFAPKFGMPVPDTSFTREYVVEGTPVHIADFTFEVIGTPGHTPGCICWYDREDSVIFTGDTLFAGTIGRTDLEFSDYDSEIVSIMEKLMVLDSNVIIYPGHGGFSDIGTERTTNPFLEPFNEPEEEIGTNGEQ